MRQPHTIGTGRRTARPRREHGGQLLHLAGLLLIVLSVVALLDGTLADGRARTILAPGPFTERAAGHRNIPWSPGVSGIALMGGITLLTAPHKRAA